MYGTYGLGYYNPAGQDVNPCRVVNNVFRDINFAGTIYLFSYSYYADTKFWHNTISLDQTTNTGTGATYVFYFFYGGNGMAASMKNNNISITRGGTGAKYAFYNGGNALSGAEINYNNIYVNGAGGNNYPGYITTAATTYPQWQAQGVDAQGTTLDPIYANLATGDLHPTNTLMNNKGTGLGVGSDVVGATRSQTAPDIGAYEFLNPACSAAPGPNSVTASAYTVCPGETVNLNVGSYNGDAGVLYQWVSSTNSNVGPWTVISGANTVNYTTPGITSTTYYGVAITCSNAVGSTTAVASLFVSGTTTNTAPYFEGFEGITKANKLPNCSWTAPGLGSSAVTYTSSKHPWKNALVQVPSLLLSITLHLYLIIFTRTVFT